MVLACQGPNCWQAGAEVDFAEKATRQSRHDFGDRRLPPAFANFEHISKDKGAGMRDRIQIRTIDRASGRE